MTSPDARSLVEQFTAAFNARDAEALGALFTPDAEFVNMFGARFRGREHIVKAHAGHFANALGGTRLQMPIGEPSILAVAPGVLLLHAHWRRERLPDAPAAALPPGAGVMTLVAVESADGWRLAAATNVQETAMPGR